MIKKLSPNFSSREGHKIEMIVVHISAGDTLESMTSWFMKPVSQASSHYGVGKNGEIILYVEEKDKSWHAGKVDSPTAKLVIKKAINPNLYSIGIECVGFDLKNAPEPQRKALYSLISDICKRNDIPVDREHIVGHYEIATKTRVNDPSPDHTLMDKIVENVKLLNEVDEMVCLQVPKSKVGIINNFFKSLWT